MQLLESTSSPFLLLWYLYLGFLGVVILVNVVSKLLTALLNRKIRRLNMKGKA